MKKVLILINLAMVLFLAVGCSSAKKDEVVLATIGDTDITVSDFNERISNLPPKYQEVVNKRKKEFLEEIINDTLLYRQAIKYGLHKDKDVKKVIAEARKKVLIARLLKDKVDDEIEITDEDIEIFYQANRGRYLSPEIMRVSHILVHSSEEAEKILAAIEGGSPFEEMARAKSIDPTAQTGGDIGYFPKGQLMPAFEKACAELEIGQISGVVKTSLGYHIIKLTDRKPSELRPIEDVTEDIKARLRNIKRQELFGALLKRLREDTEIYINEKILVNAESKTREENGS
jgi:peptidyl-prolyl cis-trans isomerase C